MRNWVKTLLFLTTFSPVLISLAAAKYFESGFGASVVYYGLVGIAGILLNVAVLRMIKKSAETIAFTAKKLESNDALMLGVLITYLLPFFTKASDITAGIMLALVVVGGVLFWFSSSILPHPVLRLLKYRFYKVESAAGVVYTLISQRELVTPESVRQVKKISNSMLVEVI